MSLTVKLTILYFAALREQAGKESEIIEITAPINAAELYTHLTQQYAFSLPQDRLRAAVNHHFCGWTQPLSMGDTVAFIPPIAGG